MQANDFSDFFYSMEGTSSDRYLGDLRTSTQPASSIISTDNTPRTVILYSVPLEETQEKMEKWAVKAGDGEIPEQVNMYIIEGKSCQKVYIVYRTEKTAKDVCSLVRAGGVTIKGCEIGAKMRREEPIIGDTNNKRVNPSTPNRPTNSGKTYDICIPRLPDGISKNDVQRMFQRFCPKAVDLRNRTVFVRFTTSRTMNIALTELREQKINGLRLCMYKSKFNPKPRESSTSRSSVGSSSSSSSSSSRSSSISQIKQKQVQEFERLTQIHNKMIAEKAEKMRRKLELDIEQQRATKSELQKIESLNVQLAEKRKKRKLENLLEKRRVIENLEKLVREEEAKKQVKKLQEEMQALQRMKEAEESLEKLKLEQLRRLEKKRDKFIKLQKQLAGLDAVHKLVDEDLDTSPVQWDPPYGSVWSSQQTASLTEFAAVLINNERECTVRLTETVSSVQVRIKLRPFARGNFRKAYHMCTSDGRKFVCKRPILKPESETSVERNENLMKTVNSQMLAKVMADQFNTNHPPRTVEVLSIYLLQVDGELMTAESFVEGTYNKYSNNFGYKSSEQAHTLHAFSHFSWCHSKKKVMIVDIQGVKGRDKYTLTDPAIHTHDRSDKYGDTDHGEKGITKFFETHLCNGVCRTMRLEMHPIQSTDFDPSPSDS